MISTQIPGLDILQELRPPSLYSDEYYLVGLRPEYTKNDTELAAILEPALRRLQTMTLPNQPIRLQSDQVEPDLLWYFGNYRGMLRLSTLALYSALRNNDADLAMVTLQQIDRINTASDLRLDPTCFHRYLDGKKTLYKEIRRSMAQAAWSEKQLQEIRDRFLQDIDYSDRVQLATLSDLESWLDGESWATRFRQSKRRVISIFLKLSK